MVNALCSVLVEVPLCIWMHVIYTFLQGPQWVWTWPAGDTEDIVCWRRMHHILYLLFWIQWGDKCKPIFYYHMAAVFLTTACRGLSDRDRKSWVVRSCYLYARPLSVTLSERWLTPSALPAQPGAHFSAQGASIPQNGVGWGCFQLGHSPCLTGPWFNGTSNHVPNYRHASSPTSLWFRSWTWPFPPNSHCGPAEDLRAAMVRGPMQSQPTPMLSLFEHSSDPLAVSTEGIPWSVMSPTAATPRKAGLKSWHRDALVMETWGCGPGRIWQQEGKESVPPCLWDVCQEVPTRFSLISGLRKRGLVSGMGPREPVAGVLAGWLDVHSRCLSDLPLWEASSIPGMFSEWEW